MNINEIVKHCQLGDKEAFRVLFGSIEKKGLSTAYLMSGKRGIAEDILQEAYIKCFNEIKTLKDPRSFNVWFYRILVRTGWEMARKHSLLIPTDSSEDYHDFLYDEKQNIDIIIGNNEMRLTVQKAINNLNEKLRTVVILHYFNGMTDSEISKVLGCLKATVKSRLFYARNILKKELADYFTTEVKINNIDNRECN